MVCLLLFGCGTKGTPGEILPDAFDAGPTEVQPTDDCPGNDCAEPPDTSVEVPGFFEQPCSGNEDCVDEFDTGWCIEIDDEGNRQCTYTCIQECPSGYSCVFVNVGGNDQVALCMPEINTTCEPCETHTDCIFNGSRCHPIGFSDGEPDMRCAVDCARTGGACDEGYECKVFPSDEGPHSLCIPTTNSCVCFGNDEEGNPIDGSEKSCASGDDGSGCPGTTTCDGENGWTPCTAADPAPEICDGLDNDCNGDTDDDLGQTTCGKGVCGHTVENCVNGKPQVCDPLEGASEEVCDGVDNDCDADVDEGCVPTEVTFSFVSTVVKTPKGETTADGIHAMMSVGLPGVQGSSTAELPGGHSVRWGFYYVIP